MRRILAMVVQTIGTITAAASGKKAPVHLPEEAEMQ